MSKVRTILLLSLCLLAAVSWLTAKSNVEDNSIIIKVPSNPNHFPLSGIGVQFDPYFFSHNIPMENGAKESDWYNVIVPRVKSMRIQNFRVGVMPQWWEPYNDNDDPYVINDNGLTWDSYDMLSLYKVLDLAEDTGAEVNLVLWGCPIGASLSTGGKKIKFLGRHFLADEGTFWVTGPANPEEFAENFVALLHHLIVDKKYTCVKEITPFNEPESRVVDIDKYVACFKAIDRRLKKMGLRKKVQMVASDNIGRNISFLQQCADKLRKEADVFSSHTYNFGYNSSDEDIFKWEDNNCAYSKGKPHIVAEFGSNVPRQTDIDAYERGVLLCRLAIDFLNAGANGVSYWTLNDHYRNVESSYANMQKLGLWRYINDVYKSESFYSSATEDYYVRPQYYAYSLLTRFVRRGDKVYPLSMEQKALSGIALLHTDKTWSYLFANGTENPCSIDLFPNHKAKKELYVYKYTKETVPSRGNQIQQSGILSPSKEKYHFMLSPNSVTVLTQ